MPLRSPEKFDIEFRQNISFQEKIELIISLFFLISPAFKKFEPENEEKDSEDDSDAIKSKAVETTRQTMAQATGLYYYHPDHLGTSTFLTDVNGYPYQFFLNLPFGETMAEQHSLTEDYESPYKFNGKEQEPETGYYYEAWYYDPLTSIWLSIDPLMEDYPNVSPYAYCVQNPINFIDPDGREPKASNPIKMLIKALIKNRQELMKSKNSFVKLLKEHKQKLADFKKDPIGNSSAEWIKSATKDNPSDEVLLKGVEGRIPALEEQLKKEQGELDKINKNIGEIDQKISNLSQAVTVGTVTGQANVAKSEKSNIPEFVKRLTGFGEKTSD